MPVGLLGVLTIGVLVMFFRAVRYLLFRFFVGRVDFLCLQTSASRWFALARRRFLMALLYFFFRFFLGGINFFSLGFGVLRFRTLRVGCSIRCGENAILRHSRGRVILSIRNVLG